MEGFAIELSFQLVRLAHIVCGFAALAIFWIPIVVPKGGTAHVRVGRVYVAAMAAVSFTALYMGAYRLLWDAGPDADAIPFSWFLIFIAVLSGSTAWYGVRVLRFKKRSAPHRRPVDLLFPLLLVVSGCGISAYGFAIGFPLLQYFPAIGLFLGGSQLVYWFSSPKRPSHWIVEHLVGMLSCCIATVTAFVVFGAPRLLGIESVSLLVWFAPAFALVPLIVAFSASYRKKMDGPRRRT